MCTLAFLREDVVVALDKTENRVFLFDVRDAFPPLGKITVFCWLINFVWFRRYMLLLSRCSNLSADYPLWQQLCWSDRVRERLNYQKYRLDDKNPLYQVLSSMSCLQLLRRTEKEISSLSRLEHLISSKERTFFMRFWTILSGISTSVLMGVTSSTVLLLKVGSFAF